MSEMKIKKLQEENGLLQAQLDVLKAAYSAVLHYNEPSHLPEEANVDSAVEKALDAHEAMIRYVLSLVRECFDAGRTVSLFHDGAFVVTQIGEERHHAVIANLGEISGAAVARNLIEADKR